jgi:hypothetical protein
VTALAARKFVLAPNLIGAALIDPAARCVLEAWRDGKFVVVTNRELIALHLRALNRVGLPAELIKRWAYWLSSPEKTLFLERSFDSAVAMKLCEALAGASNADAILCWTYPSEKSDRWLAATDFR